MKEATWEPKLTMRAQYPQLFSLGNFEDEISFKGGGGGGGNCNTPKYTLVVFSMFRVFCRYNLKFCNLNTRREILKTRNLYKVQG